MPIGDLGVPILGKNVVIAVLVQTHILIAAFILGAALIAPTAEYLGMVTKQPKYERFAKPGEAHSTTLRHRIGPGHNVHPGADHAVPDLLLLLE